MKENPLVSVLMTAYNREKYIADAIESVIDSDYSNWELIIVDDCSSDKTMSIAKKYEERDSRIRVFINEKNLGDYPNRNRAASYARGMYLKYLDADDTIYKYSLNYMVESMQKFPTAALGISYNTIDDDLPYPQLSNPKQTYYSEYFDKSILGCGPSSAIIQKSQFDLIGGFSGKQYIGDTELWLTIAMKFDIVKLQPALTWYRRHEEQQIVKESKNFKILDTRYKLSLQFLHLSKDIFNDNEFKAALRNCKRKYAKTLLKKIIKDKEIINGLKLWKMSGISIFDLR